MFMSLLYKKKEKKAQLTFFIIKDYTSWLFSFSLY